MKSNYVILALIGFFIFLGITIIYYLSNDYEIEFIRKNNIEASINLNIEYDEVLLPVSYLEYDINKTYWGYINTDGDVAISLNYDKAYDFDENYLAVVKYDGKYGLINTKNEKVLKVKYDVIKYMGEDIYYYASGKKGYLALYNSPSKLEVIKEVYYNHVGTFNEDLAVVVRDKKVGYINKDGLEVIPLKYDYKKDFNYNFYNGYAFFYKNNKYGIINNNGIEVVAPKYEDVINDYVLELDFTDIYFSGYELIPVKIDGKWGYIKPNGETIIEPKYLEAYPFTDSNLARVKLTNDYYNFINPSGELLNSNTYDEVSDFYNGYAMTSFKVNKKEGLIDHQGLIVIPNEYDYVGTYQQNRVLTIKNGVSKYHLLDNFDNDDTTIKIDYYLGDDMTDCKVMFATDDKVYYAILNLEGKRVYKEVTAKDYKQIENKGKKYIKVVAYEKKSNLEYLTYIDEDGKILWKVYK